MSGNLLKLIRNATIAAAVAPLSPPSIAKADGAAPPRDVMTFSGGNLVGAVDPFKRTCEIIDLKTNIEFLITPDAVLTRTILGDITVLNDGQLKNSMKVTPAQAKIFIDQAPVLRNVCDKLLNGQGLTGPSFNF